MLAKATEAASQHLGDAVPPGPLGFFALELETAGARRAGHAQSDPLFTGFQAGAQVAVLRNSILG